MGSPTPMSLSAGAVGTLTGCRQVAQRVARFTDGGGESQSEDWASEGGVGLRVIPAPLGSGPEERASRGPRDRQNVAGKIWNLPNTGDGGLPTAPAAG